MMEEVSSYLQSLHEVHDELIARSVSRPAPRSSADLVAIAALLTAEINRVNGYPK
jgi:hypothetical protein